MVSSSLSLYLSVDKSNFVTQVLVHSQMKRCVNNASEAFTHLTGTYHPWVDALDQPSPSVKQQKQRTERWGEQDKMRRTKGGRKTSHQSKRQRPQTTADINKERQQPHTNNLSRKRQVNVQSSGNCSGGLHQVNGPHQFSRNSIQKAKPAVRKGGLNQLTWRRSTWRWKRSFRAAAFFNSLRWSRSSAGEDTHKDKMNCVKSKADSLSSWD